MASHDQALSSAPNPEIVFSMVNSHHRTHALNTAIELDLFRAIGAGPGDLASLAQHCSASERGLRILCDFLVISGVLAKDGAHYRHTPASALFLDPASPACMATVAKFMMDPRMNDVYNHLGEIVRSGRTSLPGSGSVEPDNPVWVSFAENMAPMMAAAAPPVAALVLGQVAGPIRVLDIAAGHGLFGIAVARQNPEAHITAVDWPAVLNVAARNAQAAGVADRHTLLPGSAFDVDFGGPYDAVLLTNFLHHFDRATCVGLLKKIHAALRPGGIVATLEFVPDENRVTPPAPASFAFIMLATTASGDAYTFSEFTSMYTEAGFSNVTRNSIPNSPETVVLGTA